MITCRFSHLGRWPQESFVGMLCSMLQHLIWFIPPICVGIIVFGLSLCGLLPDNDKLFPYPAKQKSTTNNPNFRRQSSLYHKKKYNRKRLNVWVILRLEINRIIQYSIKTNQPTMTSDLRIIKRFQSESGSTWWEYKSSWLGNYTSI